MPGKRKWMRAQSRTPVRSEKRAIDVILADRHRLMIELDLLRGAGRGIKSLDNAQELLTRWWSSASWTGREELLKSARWLIELAKNEHTAARSPQPVSVRDEGAVQPAN